MTQNSKINKVRVDASGRRVGLTLVELLIVMGLLTLLATFSLSGMRDLMRSQKVSQASTLVKQYLENAQIRAITNGRPVAVFLDRVSIVGDRSLPANDEAFDAPLASNYTITRLQFGEVFPPYVGDVQDVVGTLGEDMTNYPINVRSTTRTDDGHADQITFADVALVASGLGVGGFVSQGDLIGLEGYDGLFRIENIIRSGNTVTVQFFNPPQSYNAVISEKIRNNIALDPVYESASHSAFATRIPLGGAAKQVRFRIFRQPTKSLVGAITLPRGTCVDISLSGIGPSDSGAAGGRFNLDRAPSNRSNTVTPADFSRIGIVFDSQGRVSYVMNQTQLGGNLLRTFTEVNSNLYLLVGRTDQVLPGLQSARPNQTVASQSLAAFSDGTGELPPSNLVDLENTWITCNPFTGEIKSSPVSALTLTNLSPTDLPIAVSQARTAAIAGLTN